MDSTGVLQLLEQLDDEIDDLEDVLSPVLGNSLSPTLSKLPVLDKAKLYVLVTYAIESILFSYLRLNGVNAREHPVFKELTRVKQYFDKIKNAETPIAKRENLSLDKKAAGRFITAALRQNDKYDLELAEREAKERARAHIKLQVAEGTRTAVKAASSSDLDSESAPGSEEPERITTSRKKKRKANALSNGADLSVFPVDGSDDSNEVPEVTRKKSKSVNHKDKSKSREDSKR